MKLRLQGPGVSTYDGYSLFINQVAGTDTFVINRVDDGAFTALATGNQDIAAGDTLLFRANGSTLEGWRHDGSSWSLIVTTTDGTYTGAGYVGIGLRGTTGRLDDFGARTTTATGDPAALTTLDDFDRADENPLVGATGWDTQLKAAQNFLEIVSNAAQSQNTSQGGGSFWLDTVTLEESDFSEAFCTISSEGSGSVPTGDEPFIGGVLLHAAGDNGSATMEGNGVTWQRAGSIAVDEHVSFGTSGSGGQLGAMRVRAWVSCADGHKLGVQKRDAINHVWIDAGSDWQWVAAVNEAGDASPSTRKFALQAWSTTQVDDFGAGASVASVIPYIYRREQE